MKISEYGIISAIAIGLGGCVMEPARVEQAPADHATEDPLINPSAVFSGTVTDEQGAPLAGVTVVINGISRVTDSAGRYFMSVIAVDTGYNLSFSKSGFAPSSEFYSAGTLDLRHALKRGFVASVNPAVNSMVEDPTTRVRVTLRANSLVTASGAAPTGMVQVTVSLYDPLRMPGDFTAVNATGERVALESVGAVFIGASDSTGQMLGLRGGMTADAFIPLTVGTMPPCVLDGSCRIAMWKFDPNTGKWEENPGASAQFSQSGTQFTMLGAGSRVSRAIPVTNGLGIWNADIEKKAPACTIIEFVGIPTECFGSGNAAQLDLKLPNSGGALIGRRDFVSSATTYIALYNIRANVVQEIALTFPNDSPSFCDGARMQIFSDPAPISGFPVGSGKRGVTRFNSGAPWGKVGYPVNSKGKLITFNDVASNDQPCKSHVWFELPL